PIASGGDYMTRRFIVYVVERGASASRSFRLVLLVAPIWWLAGGPAFSETVVQGTLEGGTWTEAGSPYDVTADLDLPSGKTLSVEAGVEVRFAAGVSLTVAGELSVLGTEEKPVRFIRADPAVGWGGVAFRGSSSTGTFE